MRVVEIFDSIQGEGITVGRPSTFVRLAGCNLRCKWCDTKYAWDQEAGEEMTTDQILAQLVKQPNIVITGGEPLLQDLLELLRRIKQDCIWKHVTVETNCTIWEPELAFGKHKYYEDYFPYVETRTTLTTYGRCLIVFPTICLDLLSCSPLASGNASSLTSWSSRLYIRGIYPSATCTGECTSFHRYTYYSGNNRGGNDTMWQDYVMAFVGYLFAFALVPSVLGKHKPARWTCLMTFAGLVAIATAVGSLGLWQTLVADTITALLWLILLLQRRS